MCFCDVEAPPPPHFTEYLLYFTSDSTQKIGKHISVTLRQTDLAEALSC